MLEQIGMKLDNRRAKLSQGYCQLAAEHYQMLTERDLLNQRIAQIEKRLHEHLGALNFASDALKEINQELKEGHEGTHHIGPGAD
ncbi:hypothetical protein LCGC14_1138880 [marine sediment metagenome]|uniref:Uncharacterized protein n=1 Tax=marine sediment metagenome TaxID=412755 RepID=A0A0F9Q4P3_9ZZZZ